MPFQYPAIINPGQITNTEVSASAAIARAKLDFGTGLADADIAASAAIAITKIATDISSTHQAAQVHTANQTPEYTTAGLIAIRMVM